MQADGCEKFLPLSAAARRVLSKVPSPPTLWRWRNRGVGGIKLQSWFVGGRVYTTEPAFRDFIHQITVARSAENGPRNETSIPDRPIPQVSDAELRAAGLLH